MYTYIWLYDLQHVMWRFSSDVYDLQHCNLLWLFVVGSSCADTDLHAVVAGFILFRFILVVVVAAVVAVCM